MIIAVIMKSSIIGDITAPSPLKVYFQLTTRLYIAEDGRLHEFLSFILQVSQNLDLLSLSDRLN
jgi:hypothetical protein